MRRIPISKIVAGLTVAREVLDASGNVLLAEGAILTEQHRNLLLRRGIENIAVMDMDEEMAEGAPATDAPSLKQVVARENVEERLAEVEQIFAAVKDEPLMRELYRLALKHAEQVA